MDIMDLLGSGLAKAAGNKLQSGNQYKQYAIEEMTNGRTPISQGEWEKTAKEKPTATDAADMITRLITSLTS